MQNKYSKSIRDYCIIKEIGRGKTGVVYTAVHQQTKELITVKKIDTTTMSPLEVGALEKESRDINGLKSKIILPSIVTFSGENSLYIVKELMDLGSIGNCLQNCRKFFSEDNIRIVLYKILVGLKALHNEGRIHRNINTENVLLDSSGKIKFTNPATQPEILDEIREMNPEKFHDLSSIFIAPEVSEDNLAITKAMDIWSVGIIAIEMVYGDFKKLSKESVLEIDGLINFRRFLDKEAKFKEIYGWIPENLLDLIKKCLATSPENRITAIGCLNLPFFRNIKSEKYYQFLKENPEIMRMRRSIIDLRRMKITDDTSPLVSQKIVLSLNSEAEKIIDEKYSGEDKNIASFASKDMLESTITRTKTGRFVLAEINTNESSKQISIEGGEEDMNQRALIDRRLTCDFSKIDNTNNSISKLKGQKTCKNEYRRGRFRIIEGEIIDLVPSREALISEIDYLSRMRNLYSRQMDMLQGILGCDSVTDRGIEYHLYKEFHELRILLDQLKLSGSPTLVENTRAGKY